MGRDIRLNEPDPPATVPPWRNRKVHVRLVGWLVGIGVALVVGLIIVYPRVEKWKKNRVLRLAEQYVSKEDYRSAYLLMEQFVRNDPTNLSARRLLAHVYEATSPEQAVAEWETLAKAEPGNPANHVGYAAAVLKVGQVGRLPAILAVLEKLAPESVEYHRLAAAAALAAGDFAALRKQVERLAALEPRNPLTQFTRAALLLNAADPGELEEARASMGGFARGEGLRIRATLALINDAPRRWPAEKIPANLYARLADELKLRGAGAAPSYVRLDGNNLPPAGLTSLIAHMEAQPSPTANDVVMLGYWLLQIGHGRDALFWLDTRDEPVRATVAVRQCMAACAASLESWVRLEQLIAAGAWGPMPAEAVKQAFVAHGLWLEHNESKAASQWNAAIRLTEQSLPGLEVLQRLAQIWRWPDKQAQVLTVLARQFPANDAAWRVLAQLARAAGNTAEYWRVHQAWAQAVPSNAVALAERALVGLLVRPAEPGLASGTEDLFQRHPEIAACRAARALALWRAGRAAEALTVLDGADLNYAREPRFALVRGLVCANLGRTAESSRMFALLHGVRLLPEERALIPAAP